MGLISQLLEDPRTFLLFFALALPGRLFAISAHESAHGWVAERCGDPTARAMGRITLNPIRHFDPVGFLSMLLIGVGWAKPVPVNPLHYKNYRRDDIKVSLAGITVNLILFVLNAVVLYAIAAVALSRIPYVSSYQIASLRGMDRFLTTYDQELCLMYEEGTSFYYSELKYLLCNAPYVAETLIEPVLGRGVSVLYQMIGLATMCNLGLAVFNLIPIPPLDGYHVLNDTILHRPLFADMRAQQISSALMLVLVMTGTLSKGLNHVENFLMSGVGGAVQWLYTALGIIAK